MKAFSPDAFTLRLPDGHRFPIDKYRLLRERVDASRLLAQAVVRAPPAASDEELCRAHDREYVRRVRDRGLFREETRRIGFPWSPEMVERSRRSVGATIAACRAALEDGIAVNLAGGTHHAFRDRGEGYCVFNDAAVAARVLQVFTFSIHARKNFPSERKSAIGTSSFPIGRMMRPIFRRSGRGWSTPWPPRNRTSRFTSRAPTRTRRIGWAGWPCRKRGSPPATGSCFRPCGRGSAGCRRDGGGDALDPKDTVDVHFRTVEIAAEISRRGADCR